MTTRRTPRLSLFWGVCLTFLVVYLLLHYAVPYVSMRITGKPYPLPVPSALMAIYLILLLVGLGVYVTISEQQLREFLSPPMALLRGGQTGLSRAVRPVVLVTFPLLVGGVVYVQMAPKVQSPLGLRIQHPTIPGQYEKLINPYRDPDEKMVKQFMEAKGLAGVGLPDAQARLITETLKEGRALYQINCRPCHGSKADSNGPMAAGFRLRPADFTDPGTISTVVESYVFWRVKEGGRGLPAESTFWDSAMPRWMDELTDDQIWKIILAEYDTAGVEPRKPEKLEH